MIVWRGVRLVLREERSHHEEEEEDEEVMHLILNPEQYFPC